MSGALWAVRSGATGLTLAMPTQDHAEAMVEAMASMGIVVEAVEWPGTEDEHAMDNAMSEAFAQDHLQ